MAASDAGADSSALHVTATVLSKSVCKFSSGTSVLDFGTLDPAVGTDVGAAASIGFRCMGSAPTATFEIASDDGLYESAPGAPRMRHASAPAEFLPYGLTLSPESGTIPKGVWQILAVSGTVRGADYRDARVGNYSDTVTLSILP